jgi:hypothetical protein
MAEGEQQAAFDLVDKILKDFSTRGDSVIQRKVWFRADPNI